MREIKFRAWDDQLQQFVYFTLGGGLPSKHVAPFTVGQFTGLHDKNGKEIYEGDVLRRKRIGDTDHKHSVEWSDEVGAFYAGANLLGDFLHGGDVEVVGNIYQNPELLK